MKKESKNQPESTDSSNEKLLLSDVTKSIFIKAIKESYEELLEKLTKLAKSNNDVGKFGDGYEKAINEAIQLAKNCSIPVVMPRLFAITAQEGWNEMFWDKEKAQHKIDTQYKKDFPNDEFWVEEVNVS